MVFAASALSEIQSLYFILFFASGAPVVAQIPNALKPIENRAKYLKQLIDLFSTA